MILDEIVAHKKQELASMLPPTKSFYAALKNNREVTLIAEVKKASPSKGVIRADFNPLEIACIYNDNGAGAISVLTEEKFFQGSPAYIEALRRSINLPLLRKDFIIDPIQIYEARLLGADAILLIAAILKDELLIKFQQLAGDLGLDCLVEVHTVEELGRVLNTGARIIGINNRDLQTFKTDLSTTFRLRDKIKNPHIAVVSESGINTRQDVIAMAQHGIDAILVGEALIRENDIAAKVRELTVKVGESLG